MVLNELIADNHAIAINMKSDTPAMSARDTKMMPIPNTGMIAIMMGHAA